MPPRSFRWQWRTSATGGGRSGTVSAPPPPAPPEAIPTRARRYTPGQTSESAQIYGRRQTLPHPGAPARRSQCVLRQKYGSGFQFGRQENLGKPLFGQNRAGSQPAVCVKLQGQYPSGCRSAPRHAPRRPSLRVRQAHAGRHPPARLPPSAPYTLRPPVQADTGH